MKQKLLEAAPPDLIEWVQEKLSNDWFEPQDITEILEESIREDHYLHGIHNVYWSLGYCQGDGVAFEGHIDLEVLRENVSELDGLMGECEALAALLGCEFDLMVNRCQVRNSGRECHWNSMELELEWDYGDGEGWCGFDALDERIRCVRDWIENYIKEVSRALERMGYAEIEHRGSAGYAAEYLEDRPELLDEFLAMNE